MDIAQYIRALRTHWLIIVALVGLGGIGAGAYSWFQTPLYQADVQLFVSISSADARAADLNQGGTFAQQRVKSYTNIVNSPTVTNKVIKSLQLPYSTSELAEKLTATSPLNTVLLDISVTDPSPQRAQAIANAVASEVSQFIVAIETPTGEVKSPVKATVTKSAPLPTTPVSPKTNLNLVLGVLVGLAAGVAFAVLRHMLDRTIHNTHEIAEVADAAVVGEIGNDPRTKHRPLIIDEPMGARAEAFRRLRTNIRFLSIDERIQSLVVTGAVPGEGKSTVAANLAITLAQAGERVVLIDGDMRKPRLASLFALSGGVGLTSVLLGDVRVDVAMQHWRRDLELYVVTSGPIPPNPSELLGSRRLAELVTDLVDSGMFVIFDSPPLLPVTDAAVLARATQGALVVTRVGSTRTDQLQSTIDALRTVDARVLGVVANRVKRSRRGKDYEGYYNAQPSGRGQAVVNTAPAEAGETLVTHSDADTPGKPSTARGKAVPVASVDAGTPIPRRGGGQDDTAQLSLKELRELT
jgi:polysaccharide biosynthesis transport protein